MLPQKTERSIQLISVIVLAAEARARARDNTHKHLNSNIQCRNHMETIEITAKYVTFSSCCFFNEINGHENECI